MSATGFNMRRRVKANNAMAADATAMSALVEEDRMVAEIEAKGLDPELCLMTVDELAAYSASLTDDLPVDRRKSLDSIVSDVMLLEAIDEEAWEDETDMEAAKEMLMAQIDNYQEEDFGLSDEAA